MPLSESTPTGQQEMERLRTFPVRVGCYSGGRHAERPQWVEREGTRLQVSSVDSQWREQNRLAFRVTLEDSRRLLLYYLLDQDIWCAAEVS